jgi:hypothetical protein
MKMVNCKDWESSPCGKKICCKSCDEKDVCKNICKVYTDLAEIGVDVEDAEVGCLEVEEQQEVMNLEQKCPAILKAITDICVQKKALEEQEKQMRKMLQEAMEQYGVKSFENDKVKFVYVAPTTRTTIDSAKLKKEHPDIVEQYSKTSNVSASVKITVK